VIWAAASFDPETGSIQHGPYRNPPTNTAATADGVVARLGSDHPTRAMASRPQHPDQWRGTGDCRWNRVQWYGGRHIPSLRFGGRQESVGDEIGAGPATPVTYVLDGRQYVSILAGLNAEARVWTFALGE